MTSFLKGSIQLCTSAVQNVRFPVAVYLDFKQAKSFSKPIYKGLKKLFYILLGFQHGFGKHRYVGLGFVGGTAS